MAGCRDGYHCRMDSPSSSLQPALAASLAALAPALVEHAHDGLVVKDAETGVWLYVNGVMSQWLGQPASELAGRTNAELFGEAATALRVAEQGASSEASVAEHKLELNGVRHEFSVLRQRVQAEGGRWLIAAVWHDLGPDRRREAQLRLALEQLEQQQQANETLRKQSQGGQTPRDSDTGLHNRAHFDDQLRREVDLSTREHREFALVSIEIDPPAEDVAASGPGARLRVLEALGRLLRSNTRAMDASCRYEDNRFAVLLSGVGLATAHSRMEGLRRQCATQIVVHDGRDIGFTVSMGVASFPHTAQTQDELRQACEAAVADARRRGGNRVALASIQFQAT
jgi:diguanylate cyclase (GGDEF)-like protein/PAS domain S-box-containing protein